MPAPRQPIEIREFARPDLPAGSALAADGARRRCAAPTSTCGTAGSPACPIRSFPDTCRPARSRRSAARCAASTARRFARGSRGVLRRAPHLRALPRLHGPSHADALPVRGASTASPTRRRRVCSAAGRRRSISSPASASRGCRTPSRFDDYIGGGCGLLTAVHILERAALRPGDSVLVQGTGAVGLSAIALARLGGASTDLRHRRARGAARSRARAWARTMCSISTRRPPDSGSRTSARPHARRRRRTS